jgi:FtsZ-binding cell division protein ZapB
MYSTKDKKLTDNDIKKALEYWQMFDIEIDDMLMRGFKGDKMLLEQKEVVKITLELFDLINRLEAEKSNLKETLDRVVGEVKGLRDTNKELQAENERLKEENQYQDQAVLNALRKVRKIRLDAYKEFAGLLEERIAVHLLKNKSNEYADGFADALDGVNGEIGDLLKELAGEDNGK